MTMLVLVFVASNTASLMIASILRERSEDGVSKEDLTRSAMEKVCSTVLPVSFLCSIV